MRNYYLNSKLSLHFQRLLKNKYYRNIIKSTPFDNQDIWCFYENLPIMKKADILENINDFVSDDFIQSSSLAPDKLLDEIRNLSSNHDFSLSKDDVSWTVEFTTGSTGKPFPVIKSSKTKFLESRYLLKKRKEIDSRANINNGFLFLHPNLEYIKSLDLWKFNEKDMRNIIEIWADKKPLWMFATPMIYANYAKYINELDLDLFGDGNLSFIEYTSQGVTSDQKESFSHIYNCKLINNFGSREFWNIAYECPHGKLHLNDEYLLVDVIDECGNIINVYGKTGDIIITNFINRDMPFTKYYLGDKAKIIKNNCSCGCQSDILELELQNDGDMMKGSGLSGSKTFRRVMRGIYFHDYINDIKKIRVVQESENEFAVYLEKEKINDTYFEERFLNRASLIIPNFSNYKVSFIYSFPFESTDYRFKEVIFKSNIKEQ